MALMILMERLMLFIHGVVEIYPRHVLPGIRFYNNTNTGYTKGAGQFGICDSGGGAGWYSGYSQYRSKISAGHIWTYDPYGGCFGTGGGGTSYIRSDYTGFQIAGNDSRIFNVYKNPYTEGRNGYIKVTKK